MGTPACGPGAVGSHPRGAAAGPGGPCAQLCGPLGGTGRTAGLGPPRRLRVPERGQRHLSDVACAFVPTKRGGKPGAEGAGLAATREPGLIPERAPGGGGDIIWCSGARTQAWGAGPPFTPALAAPAERSRCFSGVCPLPRGILGTGVRLVAAWGIPKPEGRAQDPASPSAQQGNGACRSNAERDSFFCKRQRLGTR